MEEHRIIETADLPGDSWQYSLRPHYLKEYIGQTKAKENLRVFIEAAKLRKEALDHVLLYGPPGLGKTTMAGIIANELGVNLRITSGPAIERPGDLAALLTNLQERDLLFIDEIHRLSHSVEEVLNVPNRLEAEPMELLTILPDGSKKKVYMRKHYNAMQPHISEEFVKLNQAFLNCGVVEEVVFGDAKCLLCDAEKVFRVVRHVLAPDPECLVTKPVIPTERWMNFE